MRLAALAALLACPAGTARAETPDSDPRAVEIAERVMDALGGRARWDALVGLRWTFQSSVRDTLRPARRHVWNKHTGWHRLDTTDREGRALVVAAPLEGPGGSAWVAGTAVHPDSLPGLKRRARSLWTNDAYWLLMPYKLRDPGVRLEYAGETQAGDVTYDRLALSFENVGETPGDRYWIYVNRATHRVDKWEYHLQGNPPPPEAPWTWEGYEPHGGLWFPTLRRRGDRVIHTRDVEALAELPSTVFHEP